MRTDKVSDMVNMLRHTWLGCSAVEKKVEYVRKWIKCQGSVKSSQCMKHINASLVLKGNDMLYAMFHLKSNIIYHNLKSQTTKVLHCLMYEGALQLLALPTKSCHCGG